MSYYGYGGYWRGYDYDYIRPRLFGGAIRTIIIINVVVYFVMVLFGLQRFFSFNFGLVPRSVIGKGWLLAFVLEYVCIVDVWH